MRKVEYRFENREEVIEQLDVEGKRRTEDVLIDLDANGIPLTCYFTLEETSSEPDLLAAADERILTLEYENLILKEGLA